jgi:hypothetical protein
MNKDLIKEIVEDFINAYNQFDIDRMVSYVHPEIEFRNISAGEVTHAIKGVEGFKLQAREASYYFTERRQIITRLLIEEQKAEAFVDYSGTLAVDLPNGLHEGDKIEMQGKSVFTFEDGKILRLEDIS